MKDTCLITGGAGFIGCALSAHLTTRFHLVVAFDNLHPQVHGKGERPAALHPAVELVHGDVTSPSDWDALLAELSPQVVIHLAAETSTGQSLTEATRHAQVNVSGTAMMLDALGRAGVVPARLVLASSRAVYGEGAWRDRTTGALRYPGQRSRAMLERSEWEFPGLEAVPAFAPETAPAPVSVYGATKLTQEHILSAWAEAFGADLAVLRLQNVFGPGQSLSNPYTGIVPLFCRIARRGESIPLYEDGAMLRDFVLVDDVVDALLRVVDVRALPNGPFDVGTGGRTTIADLARLIATHYGAPTPHVCAKFRPGDVRHGACRIERTTEALGWTPRRTLEDGLRALAAWIETDDPEPGAWARKLLRYPSRGCREAGSRLAYAGRP